MQYIEYADQLKGSSDHVHTGIDKGRTIGTVEIDHSTI